MSEILAAYPSAKIALFQRFHIGGCAACGYQPEDTLEQVRDAHDVHASIDELITCIRSAADVEARLHVSAAEVAATIARGETISFVDARSQVEFDKGHITGARLLNVELTFEMLDVWPKDTPVVLYSNRGERSLERASYFLAYGLTRPKSLDGGLKAWRAAQRRAAG